MGIEDNHMRNHTRHRNGFWIWNHSGELIIRVRSTDPEVDFYPRSQTDDYIGIVRLTNLIAVDSNGFAYPNQYGMLAWMKAKSGIETRLFATEKSWEIVRIDPQAQTVFNHEAFKDFRLAARLFCHFCEIENQYSFEPMEEPKPSKPEGYGTWS